MRTFHLGNAVAVVAVAVLMTACAVRPTPDPRSPAEVRDGPVLLRVCYVEGDGAHLSVGDQVELDTSRLGRLRIRHLQAPTSQGPIWNGGDDVQVRTAMLAELVERGDNGEERRRFVPVGRFEVGLDEGGRHLRFDFLASKATDHLENRQYPECNVDLGADEVLIRGVEDTDRHGGHAIVR
jgi:hypothetical protein